jgi:hypothetical protein
MSSSFQWLYYRAAAGARENFSTEAIALAIRVDPRPFVRVLRSVLGDGVLPEVNRVECTTEFPLEYGSKDGGRIDLVLVFHTPVGRREFWIEAKIDAPEQPDQLKRYLTRALELTPSPKVLQLGGWTKLFSRVDWITWQQVRDGIRVSDSAIWLDFQAYLEENLMADDFNDPISSDEVDSIAPATRMLHKTARLIRAATQRIAVETGKDWITDIEGKSQAAKEPYWVERALRTQLSARFREGGELCVAAWEKGSSTWTELGWFRDGAELKFGVRVKVEPSKPVIRQRVSGIADQVPLGGIWLRSEDGPIVLGAYSTVAAVLALDDPAEWLVDRYRELNDAGLLTLVSDNPIYSPGASDVIAPSG